jgi:hypothetical protein
MAPRTFRCRAETIQILKAVEAGADLATGMTRERAVRMLTESIVFYEQMLRRYGWRDDARLSTGEFTLGDRISRQALHRGARHRT